MNSQEANQRSLYTAAEAGANSFNLKCLVALCFFVLVAQILNEIRLFKVDRWIMLGGTMVAFIFFIIPVAVWFFHDKLMKDKAPIIESVRFKYLIIAFSYLGIGIISVTLSFHVVILLTVPTLMAAQYWNQQRLFAWTTAAAFLLVPVSVYGGFLFGASDRNFIKGMLTDEEAVVFANRLPLLTADRAWELLLHYVIPRLLCVMAISILAFGITRRNGLMLARQAELSRKVEREMRAKSSIQSHVIDSLATLIETRDAETGGHVIRTKKYVGMIAEELRKDDKYKNVLTDEVIERIQSAAPLHDVGKITVSDTILLKPGKLTGEEFEKMKLHTVIGGTVIKNTFSGIEDDSFIRTAEEIAVSHHERWDGKGYPSGLSGEDIPLPARIMAVADVFDALVSVRVYKAPIPADRAFDIIVSESGTHFDPDVIRAALRIKDELIKASLSPVESL